MKKIYGLLVFSLLSIAAFSQSAKQQLQQQMDHYFSVATNQYKLLEKNTPDSLMPKYYDPSTNKLITSDTKWWCSGFFPGTLWYLYEYTKDASLKQIAEKRLGILEKEKYFTGNHDLGFMMYCSFGNAYRLTGNPAYKEAITTAAASLATRYRPAIKSIQSWNKSNRLNCPVIIDNMMNLELLYWASDHGADAKYRDIAVTHANTTIQNHFRPDYSTYHVIDYDLETGTILKKVTAQGADDTSAWARGQAWGLYGFTMLYRFSKNKTYLQQAQKIATFLLQHPNLPADKIPYWDFNAPGIPNTYRDASAGAIMASALLELAQCVKGKEKDNYIHTAEQMLLTLATPEYLSQPGENGGFLIKHNVGSLPAKSEVDVPLTYADYYFIEALLRYKKWVLKK